MIKKIVVPVFLFILTSCTVAAQSQVEVSRDPENGRKVLKGIISRELFINDTAFDWFDENQKEYTPYKEAVAALKADTSLQLIAFMGTWCHDSHFVIPRLYALLDEAGFPTTHLTLIGTDREKKTLSHLAEALNIVSVPTIIVMKQGKELGRVVEYGKYGLYDMELAEIIQASGK